MSQGIAISDLREVVVYLETQLSDSALGLKLLDPLTGPTSNPTCFADAGANVTRIRSVNTEQYRGRDYIRIEDEIRILTTWRVKPKQQRVSRNAAYNQLRDVVKAVTQLTTERRWHPTLLTETETLHASGEWLLIDTRWRFVRDVAVGIG